MPMFRIYGARLDSGADVVELIRAENPREAEAVARARQIVTNRVVEVEDTASIQRTDHHSPLRHAPPTPPTSGHSHDAPSVNVNLPKRASSLGITSFILALFALAICWIPFIGLLAIPVGAISLLLALIALLVSFSRSMAGIGWPVAGSVTALLATAVSGFQAFTIGTGLSAFADTVDPAHTQSTRLETDWEPPIGFAKDEISFSLKPPEIAPIPLQRYDGTTSESDADYLHIAIEIKNRSPNRKLDVRSLQPEISLGERLDLVDNFGNRYARIVLPPLSELPSEIATRGSVSPGDEISLHAFFEIPIDQASAVTLNLPAERFGGRGTVVLNARLP